jgi:hypothetical protein
VDDARSGRGWLDSLRDEGDPPPQDDPPRREQPDGDRRYSKRDLDQLRRTMATQIGEWKTRAKQLEDQLAAAPDVEGLQAELSTYRQREAARVESLARRNLDTFRNLPKQLQRLAPGDPTDEGTDQDQLAGWLVTAVGEAGAQQHIDHHGRFADPVRPARRPDPDHRMAELQKRVRDVQLGRLPAMPPGVKR